MSNEKNPVILAESDFRLLKQYVENLRLGVSDNEMTLTYELNRAEVVTEDRLSPDTVRLNAEVKVREVESNRMLSFTIVMPDQADIKRNRVSVLTPMGSAVIGLRKGNKLEWKMPAGLKKLEIVDVKWSA